MKKTIVNNVFICVNLLCLLIFSMQLYQAPDIKTLIWLLVMWIYIIATTRKNVIDFKSLFLLVGMCLHAYMFGQYNDQFTNQELVELAVIPFFAYIGGKLLVAFLDRKKLSKGIKLLVLIVAFGITVHATLNYMNYLETGFIIESGKRWLDYWSQVPLFSTEHSFYGAMMAGLLFYACYELVNRHLHGILVLLGVIWVNYINIQVMNRMVFAITIVVFLLGLIIYAFLVRKDKKKIKIILVITGCLAAAVFVILYLNIGGIRDTAFYSALLNRDGGVIKNVRFQIYWSAIKQIIPCWQGGMQMDLLGYDNAHNFWLQVAYESGIIPFLCLVIYTVWNFYDILKLLMGKNIDISPKLLLVTAYLGMFCYFMTEQGGNGTAEFIMYFTLMGGIISQTVKIQNMEKKDEHITDS